MLQLKHGILTALIIVAPGLVFGQSPAQPSDAPLRLAQADEAEDGDNGTAQMEPTIENFDRVLRDIDGLEAYNALLERQLQAQEQELQEIREAIERVPDIERQIPPLLLRMVDGLEEFIALDLPFHQEVRADSVAELKTLVESADASVAEKFRRIMEAWQIETEYGRTYEGYTGNLEINGTSRQVEFLRLGRIALIYQTPDDDELTGIWDPGSESWVNLGSRHRNSVRQALRMANNQMAPDLVLLPVPPPERPN